MKKSIKTFISLVLTAILVLSLSSCSIFEAMRENALNSKNFVPETTPEESEIIDTFNAYLENSLATALTVKESISYSAGTPDILKSDDEEAGILDAAAKQLKNFIISAKPGKADNWLKGAPDDAENVKDVKDSLLEALNKDFIMDFDFSRNVVSEAQTDEHGNEVKDEEGNVIMVEHNGDNVLHLNFYYYDTVNLNGEEYATDENGKAAEETTVLYSDKATVEDIFGLPLDKTDVLKNFENISNYITVGDYEIEYTNCRISSDADIEDEVLSFVKFQKEMKITADAQGVGALSSYGDIKVVFTLTQTVNYEFTYAEDDDNYVDLGGENEDKDTTEASETTTEEQSVSESDVSSADTTSEISSDIENTSVQDTSVASDSETTTESEVTA